MMAWTARNDRAPADFGDRNAANYTTSIQVTMAHWKLRAFLDGFSSVFNIFSPPDLPRVRDPYEGKPFSAGFEADHKALRSDWERVEKKLKNGGFK